MSLKSELLQRGNSLNIIRLLMAILVIVDHARLQITANFSERYAFPYSSFAVGVFFIISGFLIFHSTQKGNPFSYMWRRGLRIFPGYWGSLLVVAFIFAPINIIVAGETWSPESSLNHVLGNFSLISPWWRWDVQGSPYNVPLPGLWNSPLWTLRYEILSYGLLVFFASSSRLRAYQKAIVPIIFCLLMGFGAYSNVDPNFIPFLKNFFDLGSYFLAGSLIYVYSDKLKIMKEYAILSLVLGLSLQLVSEEQDFYIYLSKLFIAYSVLQLGAIVKTDFASKIDISYGVYIYAWPVQQMLIFFGSANWGVVINIFLTLILTIPIAWISWRYIEKPCLRSKDIFRK
ncbi:acyltransferase [Rothia sp. ZJ932]|uniref:acyltransferase family protein n=1 Tax=Rothia sp. ZJ932 TaxID=2810516 RepID=UPI00196717A3|nr:acyltransferase [Rothia sp. ZJ932]QRZ61199.1 acyltransferase [Rothia sp. ZJ932]